MNRNLIEAQAKIFKALGHPSRLLMVRALTKESLCVCELQKLVQADMSTVSKHLNVLKEAGIVSDEKKGLNVYYSLELSCVAGFLNCTSEFLQSKMIL